MAAVFWLDALACHAWAPQLPAVQIAPVGGLRVFAIGSPHGLELTLTEGLFDDEAGLVTIETVSRLASARKDGRRDEVVKRHPAVRDGPYAIHPRYSKGKRPQHFIGKFNLNINPSPFPFVQDG